MDLKNYGELMTAEMLMGPNSAVILEEILRKHPLCLTDRDIVLDLGCGKGLTSLILRGKRVPKYTPMTFGYLPKKMPNVLRRGALQRIPFPTEKMPMGCILKISSSGHL